MQSVDAIARKALFLALLIGLLVALSLILSRNCPNAGFALSSNARTLHRLKNRTVMPQPPDFDPNISLNALLAPGDDTYRWSTQRAARIEVYVLDVANARPEATNCYLPCRRDIHIVVADRKGAPPNEQVILEVTPNMREWAARQGWDWSEPTLRAQLLDHSCAFEGWLFFDVGHADQAENTSPHNPNNWRATAWELHPITKITVVK